MPRLARTRKGKICAACSAQMLLTYIVCPACGHVEGTPIPEKSAIDFQI